MDLVLLGMLSWLPVASLATVAAAVAAAAAEVAVVGTAVAAVRTPYAATAPGLRHMQTAPAVNKR